MTISVVAVVVMACGGRSSHNVSGGNAGSNAGGHSATGGQSATGGRSATGGQSTTGGRGGSGGAASGGEGGVIGAAGTGGCTPLSEDYPGSLYRGVWLCGWSGNIDHYSWVSMLPANQPGTAGTWSVLAVTCPTCDAYFPCDGTGGLQILQIDVKLTYPAGCVLSTQGEIWSAVQVCQADASAPKRANAILRVTRNGAIQLACYRYPLSQCNSTFTACDPPWP